MQLRTIYSTLCAIIGAMVGAVLAAGVMLIFAVIALLNNGLPGSMKITGYIVMIIVAICPILLGVYVGRKWAMGIEKKPDVDMNAELLKAKIFLVMTIIVFIGLLIVSIIQRY